MTRSRTTLAAVVLSGIFTWFLTFKPRYRVFATAATLLLFVAIGLALGLARGNIRAAVAGKLAMGRSDDVTTLTGRLPLWELLWEAIEEQPLIGHGYLAFWTREKIEYMSDQLNWEVPHGHNMYLDVLLDGGLIGLVLFGAIFLLASAQSLFRSIVYRDRDMALVFGFVSFAIVHGVAESLFKLPTFLAFMLLALLLRMALQSSAPPTAAVQSAGDSAVLLEPAT
jgi:O-antigen ligase